MYQFLSMTDKGRRRKGGPDIPMAYCLCGQSFFLRWFWLKKEGCVGDGRQELITDKNKDPVNSGSP
jgi:hypothetical protein